MPNIWLKMFPELLKEKSLAQIISYLAFNPYGASLLTTINFQVPTINSAPPPPPPPPGGEKWDFHALEKSPNRWINCILRIPSWRLFIFMFLPSIVALVMPNMWLNMCVCVCAWGGPEYFYPMHNYCKIRVLMEHFWIRWIVIRAEVCCPHVWARLVLIVLHCTFYWQYDSKRSQSVWVQNHKTPHYNLNSLIQLN